MKVKKSLHLIAWLLLSSLTMIQSAHSTERASKPAAEHVWQAADGVYKYGTGHGFNSMFVITTDGVIVFDSANTQHATGMLAAIKEMTDQPVRYVVQSHNHWDHAGGGQVFRDQGATILAHVEAYQWMKANPHHDLALPDEVWAGKRKDLILGGKTIELHYLGMNHGLGMTISFLPKEQVSFIADLVTPNRVLFTIVPDFNITEWVRSLKEIEKIDFNKAIYSHTHSEQPFGSMQDVVLTREFIEDLQAAITAQFKLGTPFEEIPGKIELKKYKDWVGYKEWLGMNTLRVMLDMWMGPYPWRPTPHYE